VKLLKKRTTIRKVCCTCLAYLAHDGKFSFFIQRKIKFLELSRHILLYTNPKKSHHGGVYIIYIIYNTLWKAYKIYTLHYLCILSIVIRYR
jgi:hypothetical protein